MVIETTLAPGAHVPERAHPGDAGVDLRALSDAFIKPDGRAVVETGVSVAIPDGYVGYVMSRSGLAAKRGVFVLNSPGVVDAGYRGTIKVILHNSDPYEEFRINSGDKIAQLVIQEVKLPTFSVVDALDETARGDGGLGSTGVR